MTEPDDGYSLGDFNADMARLNGVLGNLVGQLKAPLPTRITSGTVKDANSFRRKIEDFQVEVSKRAKSLQQVVLLEALAAVTQATPVGNKSRWKRNLGKSPDKWQPKNYVGGNARRNWQIKVGGVTSKGRQLLGAIETVVPGQFASLANPVPYMERLNNGWSRQAPAGFIDAAIAGVLAKYPAGGRV
jgi:hypothetical protein